MLEHQAVGPHRRPDTEIPVRIAHFRINIGRIQRLHHHRHTGNRQTIGPHYPSGNDILLRRGRKDDTQRNKGSQKLFHDMFNF